MGFANADIDHKYCEDLRKPRRSGAIYALAKKRGTNKRRPNKVTTNLPKAFIARLKSVAESEPLRLCHELLYMLQSTISNVDASG